MFGLSGIFSKIKSAGKALNPYSLRGVVPEPFYKPFKMLMKCFLHMNLLDMGSLIKLIETLSNNTEPAGD